MIYTFQAKRCPLLLKDKGGYVQQIFGIFFRGAAWSIYQHYHTMILNT